MSAGAVCAGGGIVIQVREKCHYCSQFRLPTEVMKLAGGVKICALCWANHRRNIRMLAGQGVVKNCQGDKCNRSFEDASGNLRMYIHLKDGIYQFLCLECSDKYEQQRSDLYRDTEYGAAKKL